MRTAFAATGGWSQEERRLRELEEQRRVMLRPRASLMVGEGIDRYGRTLALDRQIAAARGAMPAVAGPAGGPGFTGQPQFYGINPTDWDRYEQSLVEQGMAGLRGTAGAAGTYESSVFGVAQGQLAAEAQRTRLGMETQEAGRRTRWEQEEAMRQWREREAQASRAFDWQRWQQEFSWRRRIEFHATRQAYMQLFGGMTERDNYNLMSTVGDARGPGPAPTGDINLGAQMPQSNQGYYQSQQSNQGYYQSRQDLTQPGWPQTDVLGRTWYQTGGGAP